MRNIRPSEWSLDQGSREGLARFLGRAPSPRTRSGRLTTRSRSERQLHGRSPPAGPSPLVTVWVRRNDPPGADARGRRYGAVREERRAVGHSHGTSHACSRSPRGSDCGAARRRRRPAHNDSDQLRHARMVGPSGTMQYKPSSRVPPIVSAATCHPTVPGWLSSLTRRWLEQRRAVASCSTCQPPPRPLPPCPQRTC